MEGSFKESDQGWKDDDQEDSSSSMFDQESPYPVGKRLGGKKQIYGGVSLPLYP